MFHVTHQLHCPWSSSQIWLRCDQSQWTPPLNRRVLVVTLQLTWMDGLLLTSVQLGWQTCRPWSWWWQREEPGWGKKSHWWHWKLPAKAAWPVWCQRQTQFSSHLARKSDRVLPKEKGTQVIHPRTKHKAELLSACALHAAPRQRALTGTPLPERIW